MSRVHATSFGRFALAGFVLLAGLVGPASGNEPTEARIKGNKVNLRARPTLSGEVVTQATLDERLRVVSQRESWIEVIAPDRSEVWVHRDFVKDGVSTTEELNIRAGAGINYSVVGTVPMGSAVEVRGQFGDWLKIAPSNCTLWVNRNMVDLVIPQQLAESPPAPVLAVPAPAPALLPPVAADALAAPASAPAVPADAAPSTDQPVAGPPIIQPSLDGSAPPPPDLKLVPLEGQGRLVQREGELKQAPFVFGRPSKFRLCRRAGTQFETICYVRGNSAQLTSLLHERLIIRGREYWVQGMKHPVVVLERIEKPVN